MTLGKPYGIQLGSLDIGNEYFHEDFRNKQALDVLLVAHGMTYMKSPVHWTQHDIDKILIVGTELYKETNDVEIDKLSQLTKGFTYKNLFIQVTMSEPIVVGKVMTMTDRSMDLQMGLQKFFSKHQYGILQTPNLEVYIMYKKAIFVFDPRVRTMECERSSKGEAALMAFTRFDNVYHLLINLSKINIKGPFKICAVTVTQVTDSNNYPEKFSAASGNPSRKCRGDDYKFMNRQVAYLQGSLNLGSRVFGSCSNKQHLTTAIMTIVYAKIDPPNSWSSAILDRVLHFGTKLYTSCLEDGPIRNLTLTDIPSKFYVGDVYRVAITIAPFLKRVKIEQTRLFCDNPITKVLKNIIDTSTFRCLLLQIDNFTYAIWQMMSTDVFYFFDGYQKDVAGNRDRYEGTSCLFMTENIDRLCEIVVNRVTKTPRSENSTLNIHGMKVVELTKLSEKEQKCKPRLRLMKMDCIRPMSGDESRKFEDSPSTVDSVAPILTAKEILKLREKQTFEKPQHRQITDLNSPSLVCCKQKLYDDIMSPVDEKPSLILRNDFSRDTFEVVRAVQSEIVRKALDGESTEYSEEQKFDRENIKKCKPCEVNCGKFVTCAEKVLLKTDLDCLKQERDELLRNAAYTKNPCDNDEDDQEKPAVDERSQFQKLPDGSEIVRGTKKMFELSLEPRIYDFENLSILVGISAIITSTKYSIGSWTNETVDYVIGCGHIMSGALELKNRMDFYTMEEHHLPKIHIKDKFYSLKMVAIQNGTWRELERILKKLFKTLDRFIIVTTHGSLAVFARKNFYYIYEYATCNMVGFRIKNSDFGSSCFLRFPDVHSMVRRIYANHPEVHDQQKFLISRVVVEKVRDQDEVEDYVPFTESQERDIIDQLRQNQMMRRDQMIEKLKTMNAKIHAEKERMKKYRQETGQTTADDDDLKQESFDIANAFNEEDFNLDANSFEQKNDEFEVVEPLLERYQEMDEVVGYQADADRNPKIKGSFALADRMVLSENLKACQFAGIFAIMYAVHHPVETMNYRSVDLILENGIRILERVDTDEYQTRKILKGIVVDSTTYELLVQEFQTRKPASMQKTSLEKAKSAMTEFFKHQKYGLIESLSCCMVVIKENNSFNLFDPYDENESQTATSTKNAVAAWTNFKNLEDAIDYMLQRMSKQKNDSVLSFKLNFIKVLSYKTSKAPKTGYFLMNLPSVQSTSNQKSCQNVELTEDEKIEWIYSTKTIPWSRLETRNAMNFERYLTASKWKEFDIEMDNKLYSMWGNIHPNMKIFKQHAGKQHLACAVVSLVMAHMYNIDEWDAILMDSIVAHGHKYYIKTIKQVDQINYQLKVEDLSRHCCINNFKFDVDIRPIIYGKLYDEDKLNFNLNRALDYVFRNKNLSGVILQCGGKFFAVGNVNNRDYFMFDSQAHGPPLFASNQGTSYVLKCCCLKVLLACIVLTLNIKCHNVKFYLYAVNTKFSDEGCNENDGIQEENEIAKENEIEKENEVEPTVPKLPSKPKVRTLLEFLMSVNDILFVL